MARLREDYTEFSAREAEILAVGPDGLQAFQRFWQENQIPYVGLPDPEHRVADQYKQEVNLLKLGRMPAAMILDRQGAIGYQHYGDSMADIPDNKLFFYILDSVNKAEQATKA